MIPDLLSPHLLPAALAGLGDRDDDVIAAAADALLPAAGAIAREAGGVVPRLLGVLWDALLDLDDLSPSTGSVMALLAELYAQPGVAAAGGALGFLAAVFLAAYNNRIKDIPYRKGNDGSCIKNIPYRKGKCWGQVRR